MSYAVADLDSLDGAGPGGAMKLVRKALGARAFGINQVVLGPGQRGLEHDERASGQEEVYVCVSGSGVLRVGDGEEVEIRPGRFVLVGPESTRQPVAGDDGLSCVVVGAPVDGAYEPPPWG